MNNPLYVLESAVNKYNHARCEVYDDRVVLTNECTGGLLPVYDNVSRIILFSDIARVVISKGGYHRLINHHPNCIHFVVHGSTKTVDQLYRDSSFHAGDYIKEGVFQLSPKSETELDEKMDVARDIKRFIVSKVDIKD